MEKPQQQRENEAEKAKRLVWDCGSSLYDSSELKSFERQLDSAIASRTLSMPHLSDHRVLPLPTRKSSKISRSFQKLLRSFITSKQNNRSLFQVDHEQSQERFYVVYDRSGELSSLNDSGGSRDGCRMWRSSAGFHVSGVSFIHSSLCETSLLYSTPNYSMETTQQTPCIAIFPAPGMGHLIPLTEFAKRLVIYHNFSVTFIVPTDGSPMNDQKAFLEALPRSINFIFLPPVSFDDLPEDAKIETRISLTVTRSLPALRHSLQVLTQSTPLSALVVDLFGTDTFDVAREFGLLPYIFFTSTAMGLSFVFHLPKLDETFSCEYRDLPEPVKLPGCVPIHGTDLLDPIQDRKNEVYKWMLHHLKRHTMAHGIIVNSFLDLEPGAFKALKEDWPGIPPVYPVGPLIQTGSTNGGDEPAQCLRWLDMQSQGSVLFVSFGSGGTLSHEQLNELALGLEMSGQRFLWVVKSPHDNAANATFFSVRSFKDPFDFLPKGFLDRTKGLGLVVPSWAPQIQVLSHGSTGGFLTHCGWNSTLESIVHGVPLIAWPLYAEQKMNAVLLTDGLKVGLRVKANENGIVGREAIAKYVKELIGGEEGKLLRKRMKDLKDAAVIALGEDGSSTKSLAEVAQIWRNHKSK
ncbi:hypothetical protein F0562_035493 [Nyssa sinensis]|uniref:Uncharacterized protein n=1 Tax=Nyssa sinensis TaxID=561372 RepID=A0A5J5AEV0_9ASTE|nr:hypothetical protein F0562_035493 [Nyssa sinensis]